MPRRPDKSFQSYSRIPWILLVFVVVAGAGLVFYGNERYRQLEQEEGKLKAELEDVKTDRLEIDQRLRQTSADLDRTSVDTRTNRGRFKVNVEEADDIAKELAGIVGEERRTVVVKDNGLVLQIDAAALFKKGSSSLSKEGRKALDKIGKILNDMRERDVWVEGHTSNDPVSEVAKGFDTNWEFTSARAVSVIRYLHDEVGIPPERLAAAAFAEFRPASRTKKDKNRRIDIALVPKGLQRVEE